MNYAQKESVFIHFVKDYFLKEDPSLLYLDNIQHNNPIPSIIDALACINNIFIHIWKKSKYNNKRLKIVHRYGSENWELNACLLHLPEPDKINIKSLK